MKIEYAKKWVKALRSGRYKQTRCTLENVNGLTPAYCCLGVLCKITRTPRHVLRTSMGPGRHREVFYGRSKNKDDMEDSVIPASVMAKTGIRTCSCTIGRLIAGSGTGGFTTLAMLNDVRGYTFYEIADCIESMIYGG